MKLSRLFRAVSVAVLLAGPAAALDLEEAILHVLETNPDIEAAEADKQALEFELDRAHAFWSPKLVVDGWAGSSRDFGERSSGPGDPVEGYELKATITQQLFDGYWTKSEVARQAYRVDAAALRVLERSEFLALEATRLYADVLRMRKQVGLARENLSYHGEVVTRLRDAFETGVVGPGDLTQGEERLLVAEELLLQFQLDLSDAEAMFLQVVGVEPGGLSNVPGVGRAVPGSLEQVLANARRTNPTIRFMQADVGAAEALRRRAESNQYPTLNLEAQGRYGEDVEGVEGKVNDVSLGLRFRYEIQGGAQRAERQEQVRRVNESRARLLSQTRLVEREVRQSWNIRRQVGERVRILGDQVSELRELRGIYETEFLVGNRSLLDVLNTQNSLLSAEVGLVNEQSLRTYIDYRVLAASGVLLRTLGIEPPVDAEPYAANHVGAPAVSAAQTGKRFDARSYRNWRKKVSD
ncbi:MAG: TolC family protein [Tropicimonas sp.]|uniref:TolC family protein n=1 Tax=Tropicimonas sp. TaxID=2067044 RepID=UPI003A83ECDC